MHNLNLKLPKYDDAIYRFQNEFAHELHMQDKILRLFPPLEVAHGGTTRQVSSPRILDTTMKLHKATTDVELAMFLETDPSKLRDFLLTMITGLQNQQRWHVLKTINKTSDAVGNTVNRKDGNLWEAYIEALKILEFSFDESGRPEYKFFMNSETAKKMVEIPPTDEQMVRLTLLIETKRRGHISKRGSRLLH